MNNAQIVLADWARWEGFSFNTNEGDGFRWYEVRIFCKGMQGQFSSSFRLR